AVSVFVSSSSRSFFYFFLLIRLPPIPTLFPYTTLFRSGSFILLAGVALARWTYRGIARPLDGAILAAQRMAAGDLSEPVEARVRSEEHTSELQSRENLVCRLLLEKKKKKKM